jgi:ubiquinone/menaquinone biosynthesis C-methylase UbiE
MPDTESSRLEVAYRNAAGLSARIAIHDRFSTNRQNWYEWVFEHFPQQRELAVLEVGCGRGDLWKINEGKVPTDWNVTLSDFSAGMLEDAKNNLAKVSSPGLKKARFLEVY